MSCVQRLAPYLLVGASVVLISGCVFNDPHRHHVPPGHSKGAPPGHTKGAPPGHRKGVPPGQAKKGAHAHGPGCGHVWRDGRWISVEIKVGN